MNTNNNFLLRLIRATGYSLAGIRTTFRNEPAFRQELLVLLLVIPLAFWFGESGVEYALLIGSWLIVITVEMLNTAIEAVVNRIGTERSELAGVAKDCGSAAVFIAIILICCRVVAGVGPVAAQSNLRTPALARNWVCFHRSCHHISSVAPQGSLPESRGARGVPKPLWYSSIAHSLKNRSPRRSRARGPALSGSRWACASRPRHLIWHANVFRISSIGRLPIFVPGPRRPRFNGRQSNSNGERASVIFTSRMRWIRHLAPHFSHYSQVCLVSDREANLTDARYLDYLIQVGATIS